VYYKAQLLGKAMPDGNILCSCSQTHGGTLQHGSHDIIGNEMASCQARRIDQLHLGAEAHDITGKRVLARMSAYLEKIAEQGVRVLSLVSFWKDAAYMNTALSLSASINLSRVNISQVCKRRVCIVLTLAIL